MSGATQPDQPSDHGIVYEHDVAGTFVIGTLKDIDPVRAEAASLQDPFQAFPDAACQGTPLSMPALRALTVTPADRANRRGAGTSPAPGLSRACSPGLFRSLPGIDRAATCLGRSAGAVVSHGLPVRGSVRSGSGAPNASPGLSSVSFPW